MKSFSTLVVLLSLSCTSLCTASLLRGSENLLKRVLKKDGNNGKGRGGSKATTTTQSDTSIDLSLCPFDTKALEDTVTKANNGAVQLNECSCNGYDDTATTNLRMDYTIQETIYDGDGNTMQVPVWTAFGTRIDDFFGEHEYQIDDMIFITNEEVYGACLQVLRNNCGMLSTIPSCGYL